MTAEDDDTPFSSMKTPFLDEKEYPVLQKLASILSRFHVRNLQHDKAFDALYRKEILREEWGFSTLFTSITINLQMILLCYGSLKTK